MGGGASRPAGDAPDRRKGGGGKKKSKDPKVVLEQRIEAGDDKEVAAMLQKSPDLVNCSLDDEGMRALQVACRHGQLEIVQLLLKLNAFLNQKNDSGATALMYAAAGGFDKICKLILDARDPRLDVLSRRVPGTPVFSQAGADVRIVDKDKQSALEYAQLNNRTKVENLLQLYACEYTW